MPVRGISKDKAARVARAHACPNCREYSFKKLRVEPASGSHVSTLKTLWVVTRTCGVCGHEQELGLDATGEIIYGE